MDKNNEKVIIVNNDRDFVSNDNNDCSANFIILCPKGEQGEKYYNISICGASVAEWVIMACETKPILLEVAGDENIIGLVRPYVSDKEYIVVLYADTPLITKSHLRDLLGFVSRKHFNACKLKRGYILKSEFVLDADEIYSNFSYDTVYGDFFQVNSLQTLEQANEILRKRIFAFHALSGVSVENENTVTIEAFAKIGRGSKVGSGASILKNTTIGENAVIEPGALIINSKIGDDAHVRADAVIENSIVKEKAIIELGAKIIHSVVGVGSKVGYGSCLIDSAIAGDVTIENFCSIDNANVMNNSVVGKFSSLVGSSVTIVVEEGTIIKPLSKIVKSKDATEGN